MKTMEKTFRSNLYLEWCPSVDRRRGTMIPADSLPSEIKKRHNPGFRSVYMFDSDAASQVKTVGRSKGFKSFLPYSDRLIIDIDSLDTGLLDKALSSLNGYKYEAYFSGGKGYHIEVETLLYCGEDLPLAHEQFVKSLDIDADKSVYRPSSLIALPGRIHPKTGERKSLISNGGTKLLEIPEPVIEPKYFEEGSLDFGLAFMFTRLGSIVANEPDQGWRHTTIWSTAETMSSLGISKEVAEELLTRINSEWKNPKATAEVLEAVRQAYRS